MTYDHELILFTQTIVEDELGNQIPGEVPRAILCNVKSIGRTEFYSAAGAGLKPELVFIINKYEYQNEDKVKFEELPYKVIKTYSTGSEEIELTCERSIGNG